MAKISRPMLYGGLVVVAVAAFLLTGEKPAAPRTEKTKTKAAITKKTSLFTQEDYDASFDSVNETAKNAFQPLVKRERALTGTSPAALALGDPNWIYTGMAEVDGVSMALMENTVTQEGAFVKLGERWQGATVRRITPESITFDSPRGSQTILLESHRQFLIEHAEDEPVSTGGMEFRPLPVDPGNLRGLIGGAPRAERTAPLEDNHD